MILPALLMLPIALSIPPEPPCPRGSSWWAEVRMAPPGAVFLRSGMTFISGQSDGRVEGRWISGGPGEVHGAIALPLDADRTLALGLSGTVGEALGVRFGLALKDGTAFEVQWPILQHPAMPLRPVWRAAHALDFGRGATGAAFGSWTPGRPPRVWLSASRDGWAVTVGSGGVSVSRCLRGLRLPIRWQVGWMRAGIPWAGARTDGSEARPPAGFPASPIWTLGS